MTRLKTGCVCVSLLLLVAAAGCKTDSKGLRSSLLGSQFDALLDETTFENPASPEGDTVALVSSRRATRSIRTLKASEDFRALVEGASGVVLVDFYADWCRPCREQSKVLHDVEEFASAVHAQIIKVNVDEHRKLARAYQVSSLPTLLVLKDGMVRQTKTGFTKRDQIEAMLR